MLTDEQLDELTTRLLKKIAPMLGLEYEEPQPVTTIEDENGLLMEEWPATGSATTEL